VRPGRLWGEGMPNEAPFRSYLPFLLYLTGIFFLNFIARVILAPLVPSIEKDLGIGHGEAGSLFFFLSLGYFVGLLGSGVVSSRFTHRWTIILSSIAVGGSLLAISLSQSFFWIRAGLILVGLSAGLYLPSGISTVTDLASSRDWGKAIAVHELAPILAFMTAPLLAEGLLIFFSWRGVVALMGGIAAVSGGTFIRFGRGGEFYGETLSPRNLGILLAIPSFWIMIGLFSMGIGASLGVYTMLPLYLVAEHGMERGLANTLVGLSRIAGLGVVFLAGWASDRLGPRRALGGALLAAGMATILLGALRGLWILPVLFSQPVLAGCFFPAGFAALSRIGPPQGRNVAVSLTIPIAYFSGGGAIPAIIGLMAEKGLFPLGIMLVGIFLVGSVFLLKYLRFYEEDANQ
jgi:NNP family nitrate/nitrite transporter-like MFS transporter